MSQYNDCMASALTAQVGSGTIPDQLYSWLVLNGALAGNLNDLWNQLWDVAGIVSGSFNDRAYAWLGLLGYAQGDLNDRFYAFWCDGGIISTETNLLLNSRLCDNTDDGTPESWLRSADDANGTGVALEKLTPAGDSWLIRSFDATLANLQQTVSLAAGDYVASFQVSSRKYLTKDYQVGTITGLNLTVTEEFPTILSGLPGWAHSKFTVSALSDITILIGMGANAAEEEWMVVSRPQIVAGASFANGTITGVECTGTPIEMVYDSNNEPLQDSNGDYLYVVS